MGDYTLFLENQYKSNPFQNDSYDYDSVRQFLNGESFRDFSNRLLSFYNDITSNDFNPNEAKLDLLNKCNNLGIKFNRNTADSWFKSGKSPKFGENDRENMFKLAFALSLGVDGVETLFNNVYLDRAFNLRNAREFIYYYCFANDKPYKTAELMIDTLALKMPEIVSANDATIATEKMDNFVWSAKEAVDIVDYILNHQHNFAKASVTAKQKIQELMDDIRGTKENPGLAYQEADAYSSKDCARSDSPIYGKTTSSTDFMLYMITNQSPISSPVNKTKRHDNFDKAKLLYKSEISNQFPDKHSFEPNVTSSYILRKCLILLFFYWYWVNDFLIKDYSNASYDSFCDDLNDSLIECGFSSLYPGNPYDWLFLYCSARKEDEEYPIDVFREIISSNNE